MKSVFETKKLIIRQLAHEDAKMIYILHNDPDVMKYISTNNSEEISLDECISTVVYWQNYYIEHPGLGIWAAQAKTSGDFIGWVALKDLDKTEDIEIGYRLLKEHWGKGYATEASIALVEYAFNVLKLSKIFAVALPENKASRNVLKKAGLKYVGIKKCYNADVVFYELSNKL